MKKIKAGQIEKKKKVNKMTLNEIGTKCEQLETTHDNSDYYWHLRARMAELISLKN